CLASPIGDLFLRTETWTPSRRRTALGRLPSGTLSRPWAPAAIIWPTIPHFVTPAPPRSTRACWGGSAGKRPILRLFWLATLLSTRRWGRATFGTWTRQTWDGITK